MPRPPQIGEALETWKKVALLLLVVPFLFALLLLAWSLISLWLSSDEDEHY